MLHIGIDVHKQESQICWLDTTTGETRQRRIETRRERFEAVLGPGPRGQVVIEAGTESEWVAQAIEAVGHVVVVVDPNYGPMYPRPRGQRHKNDVRDAEALARASAHGTYRPAHRASAWARQGRQWLTTRETLVRTRTRVVSVVRATLRGAGLRVPSGAAETVAARVRALALPAALAPVVEPLLALLEAVETQVATADAAVADLARGHTTIQRLRTVPRVGVLTSLAFVATLDTVERFQDAQQVTSYLGLVPRDDSSGTRRRAGHISKRGPTRLRYLLVQAAWGILFGPEVRDLPLRRWAERVASRRGRAIAAVALARRLARILFALWRDETRFDPQQGGRGPARAAA